MQGAAPLVRDALLAYADGRTLTLPARPPASEVEEIDVCATSGMKPGPHCPIKHEVVAKGRGPTRICDWHVDVGGGRIELRFPAEVQGWVRRLAGQGRAPSHAID
jgi:hypothetical protein